MKVKSNIKTTEWTAKHNQTASRGLKVKSGVKAGNPTESVSRHKRG